MNNSLTKIRERLRELDIKPSKGLGQNFLTSDSAYKKIIEASEIRRGETILEIGPGLGTLTEYLVEAGVKVVGLEKDRKLISFLTELFSLNKSVTILEGDVLKINPYDFGLAENNYKVVANIPYYITSRLLRTIFDSPANKWPKPKLVVLLVQREVAQRIIAQPPHMNILALSVQYFAQPKIIAKVPKGSFYPMPNVDSAIIKIVPNNQWVVDSETTKNFFKVIRIGFSSKRKKLINNLSTGFKLDPAQSNSADRQQRGRTLSGTSKKTIENILISIGVDPGARPENLTIQQWQELAKEL